MAKRSLIIGMGFGGLYKQVLTEMGHEVVTVDPDPAKGADYATFSSIPMDMKFDTANICTPNYLHEPIARMIADRCNIVCVEKPGVATKEAWEQLVKDFPYTRFMMTKNNQWRDNIEEMKDLYANATNITVRWINHNRVPNAGTWFTTREFAYGGVSRDLLPHLLSLYVVLEPNWPMTSWTEQTAKQHWQLSDLTSSDYGTVKADGTYDVDDYARLATTIGGKKWEITADWKGDYGDEIGIYFDDTFVPLGLCPESAYRQMMETAINNVGLDWFWKHQYMQDTWIHANIAL